MNNIRPKIQDKNKFAVTAEPTTCSAGKLIRAKDFPACRLRNPKDLYLVQKFRLSPKQIAKVYEALIEKGWLSEFEYNHRRIATDTSKDLISGPSVKPDGTTVTGGRGPEIRGIGQMHDRFHAPPELLPESPPKLDSFGPERASFDRKPRRVLFQRPEKRPFQRPEICPKGRYTTDPCSPEACLNCGVIFSKLRQTAKRQEVSIWEPDSRYR
jgi:hypothetical protein